MSTFKVSRSAHRRIEVPDGGQLAVRVGLE
jgi:hypothetical protein